MEFYKNYRQLLVSFKILKENNVKSELYHRSVGLCLPGSVCHRLWTSSKYEENWALTATVHKFV